MSSYTMVDEAATAHSLFSASSPQVLATTAAVLPILVYPFFPTTLPVRPGKNKDNRENPAVVCLLGTSFFQLVFLHGCNVFVCAFTNAASHDSPFGADEVARIIVKCVSVHNWILQLNVLVLLACRPVLHTSHSWVPGRIHIFIAATWAWSIVVYALFRFFDDYVFENNPAYAFTIATGLGYRLFDWFAEVTITVFHGFMTVGCPGFPRTGPRKISIHGGVIYFFLSCLSDLRHSATTLLRASGRSRNILEPINQTFNTSSPNRISSRSLT